MEIGSAAASRLWCFEGAAAAAAESAAGGFSAAAAWSAQSRADPSATTDISKAAPQIRTVPAANRMISS